MIYKTCFPMKNSLQQLCWCIFNFIVQKQKDVLAWMGIFLKVNSICTIQLWILLNSLLWMGKLLSRCIVPEFLANEEHFFLFFPTSLHIPMSYLMKYVQLLMLDMAKQSKIIILAYYIHCGLYFIQFFSFYDSVLLIYISRRAPFFWNAFCFQTEGVFNKNASNFLHYWYKHWKGKCTVNTTYMFLIIRLLLE